MAKKTSLTKKEVKKQAKAPAKKKSTLFANGNKKKKTVSISSRDKKLLIVLGAVIIFLCTYFFGFSNKLTEVQDIEAESDALRNRIEELNARVAQAPELEERTKEMKEEMKEMLEEFPSDVRTENLIYLLDFWEKDEKNELKIASESLGTRETFYQTGVAQGAAPEAAPAEGGEAADVADNNGSLQITAPTYATGNETEDAMEQLEQQEAQMLENAEETEDADTEEEGGINLEGPYFGYKRTSQISFTSTYDGVKRFMKQINNNDDKVRIDNLSFTYDNTTGAIAGNMTLNFYAIGGNGKEYVAPKIKGIELGTENIFGTIQKNVTE